MVAARVFHGVLRFVYLGIIKFVECFDCPHALTATTRTTQQQWPWPRQKSLLQFQLPHCGDVSLSLSSCVSPSPLHICLWAVLENGALAAIAKWTVARKNNNNNTGKHTDTQSHAHTHAQWRVHTFRLFSWFIVVAIWQPYYFPVACLAPPSLSLGSLSFLSHVCLFRLCHFKVLR